MFLGKTQEARALYLENKDRRFTDDTRLWEEVILDDFAELEKRGLTHPLMDEIRREFSSAQKNN